MRKFNAYTSVLTEGFEAKHATPPGFPSKVSKFRSIGRKEGTFEKSFKKGPNAV